MSVSLIDYINALKTNTRKYIIKLEMLDFWTENVVTTITSDFIDGDIQINKENGARRSASITLNNIDGDYTPDPDGIIWLNSKIRIYTGLEVGGENYYVSRGIFVVNEPDVSSNFSEKIVTLSLLDKWCLLNDTLSGQVEYDFIIPVGTNLGEAVEMVLEEAGEPKPLIYEETTIVTPYTLVVEAGGTFSDILIKLSEMASMNIFYDKDGFPRLQSPTDTDIAGSVWDFNNTEPLYMGANRNYDMSKVRNVVRVVGDSIEGTIYDYTASDTDSNSPTFTGTAPDYTDGIGRRVKVIYDDLIYSESLAEDRANYELEQAIQIYESVPTKTGCVDLINEDNIITITDSSLGLDEDRFLVQSINFPIRQNRPMDLNVWKVRSFV